MKPTPGAHHNIPFADYLAWDAVNWHRLRPYQTSSLEGHHQECLPDDQTAAMEFGTAFHTTILEPEKFGKEYAVMPAFEGHHNSNAYKAQRDKWREDNRGKGELTQAEYGSLGHMRISLMNHPLMSAILNSKGRNEISIVWKDTDTSELCKGRIDRLCRIPAAALDPNAAPGTFVVAMPDFKKCSKGNFYNFDKQVGDYGYHGQQAFYWDGLTTLNPAPVTPLIVAVMDEAPYDVAVYTCMDAAEHGRRLYKRLLNQYIECRKAKSWPGIAPVGTIPVVLRPWNREPDTQI
jgi:exodeoxyribonuclease VIII